MIKNAISDISTKHKVYTMLTMLDRATRSLGTTSVMSNVALTAGSSQHGNASRASVGWRTIHTKPSHSVQPAYWKHTLLLIIPD